MRARWMLPLLVLVLLPGCSDDPERVEFGDIEVLVVDPMVGPVADVQVTVMPAGTALVTDESGRAVFHVPAGDHVVEAKVCCVGPGFIEHHRRVTVEPGKTVRVELEACLACV